MNARNLGLLVVLLIVLSGIFYSTRPVTESIEKDMTEQLFADVDPGKIAKLSIRQGENSIDVALVDGTWTLPSRGGYHAEYGKVRALLLKLLGLNVSQKVTKNTANHGQLGLTDEAVEKGRGKIEFFDAEGAALGGLYVGEFRKKREAHGMPTSTGQYVRRTGQDQVWLISDAVTIVASLSYWLDTSLANVLASEVEAFSQHAITENGEKLTFRFERSKQGSEDKGAPNFDLAEPEIPSGKKLNESIVTQLRSGLESLRITDVMKRDDEAAAELSFDQRTVYQLSNALRYTLETAEKEDTFYAKVSVAFDDALAAQQKAAYEEMKNAAEAAAAAENEKPEAAAEEESVEKEENEKPAEVPPLKLSNAEEAATLNDQYAAWVYEIPKYLGQRFRFTPDRLFDDPKKDE